MNRQAKRMMQRQKTAPQDRAEAIRQRKAATTDRKKRTPPGEFLKQVRQELKKVAWPSRQELWSYTVVVLVAVVVLTTYVFGLDFFFSKVVLRVFGQGT
jgi:preprotein translocase subunit SecE